MPRIVVHLARHASLNARVNYGAGLSLTGSIESQLLAKLGIENAAYI